MGHATFVMTDELPAPGGEARPSAKLAPSAPDQALSDHDLVRRARAGTPGIETELYARLAPLVNRLVWSTLGPDPERTDVAHDVFIRIFRGVAGLREPERLELWASRITINAVRNELRRRRLRRWVFWNAFEDPGPLRYTADLDGRELLKRAHATLSRMPADERVVLSLRLFETGTLDALAATIGCSRSTAKRRLQRARERFVRLARQDPLLEPWLEASDLTEALDDG